ncbi:MAG: XRE family transcriptional regulator [Acidobacteriaceae bacterium]
MKKKTPPVTLEKEQINPETAESFIGEKKIGERIKRLRLKKSMGLVEMGKHTGLSASFLSQLETGRVVPTLRNLARIAMVFSKDLSYFFEPEPRTLFRVHRQSERVRLPQSGVNDPTYFFESLGYLVPDRTLDPYLAEFIPVKKNVEVRPHVHPGFEFLYVLTGELELRHGSQVHLLAPGDSVYFDASTPHSYRCSGTEVSRVVIVTQHQAVAHPSMHLRPMSASLETNFPAGPSTEYQKTVRDLRETSPTSRHTVAHRTVSHRTVSHRSGQLHEKHVEEVEAEAS